MILVEIPISNPNVYSLNCRSVWMCVYVDKETKNTFYCASFSLRSESLFIQQLN